MAPADFGFETMKTLPVGILFSCLTLAFSGAVLGAEEQPRPEGGARAGAATKVGSDWQPLFDGRSLSGWRSFKKSEAPTQGWVVEEGLLKKKKGVRGGDILTTRTFGDFDLEWEWKIEPGGNNGVKYFILEERGSAIGHEYQLIDDEGHPDGRMGAKRTTASFYDVLPPSADKPLKKPGEWNHSRVLVQGNQVEHWLNGAKVLQYELGSPAVLSAVQQSKFKTVAGFGTKQRGHILLTDHQDECWFRNLRIRELAPR
jgi:hypothetical protein